MPYITARQRDGIDAGRSPANPGELNYHITQEVIRYIDLKGLRYNTLAEVTGVLENVKQELYRRIAIPYEDVKIHENGDVYPSDVTRMEPRQ